MRELCEVAFRGIVRNQESLHANSISIQNDVDTYCIPVVPHKAVAEVSKIGNL